MSETRDTACLNILYKVCAVHKYNMSYWLTIPEFVDKMMELKAKRIYFTNQNVLDAMQVIYDERDNNRSAYPDFNFSTARQAINQIKKVL